MIKNLCFIFTIIIAGCGAAGTQIRGSGQTNTVQRAATAAVSIDIAGNFQTEIVRGEPGISITGDDNLLPYVITEMKADKLFIYKKYGTVFFNKNPIVVKISMPAINEISMSGSGMVTGSNRLFTAGSIGIYLKGSGSIYLP